MHSMGLHSALAIKRQRKRREDHKKAKERRFSSQSTESGFTSPRNSIGSLDNPTRERGRRGGRGKKSNGDDVGPQVVTSVGMLHIGIVFLVLGAFLLVSGLLPGDLARWGSESSGGWFNELVLTGGFSLGIGIFLIILNKIISKREEEDLNEYVQRQLTRSRSGHRLVRDIETGNLQTKHDQRARLENREDELRRQQQQQQQQQQDETFYEEETVPVHSPHKSPIYTQQQIMNGDVQPIVSPHLEKILEEEISEKGEEESRAMDNFNKEIMSNGSTTTSMSPGTPSETQELLSGRHLKMSNI